MPLSWPSCSSRCCLQSPTRTAHASVKLAPARGDIQVDDPPRERPGEPTPEEIQQRGPRDLFAHDARHGRARQTMAGSIMSNSTGKANHQRRAQQCPGFKSVIAQKECPRDDLRYLMEGACAPAHDPRKIKPPDVFFTA